MSARIHQTTDATFDVDVLQSDIPVLLDFWAPWCGPCKAIAPVLERLAVQHEGRIKIVKYNVDQNPDSYARFKIRGVPTLVAIRDGEEVARGAGVSAGKLKGLLDSLLNPTDASVFKVAKSAVPSRSVLAPVVSTTFGGDADRKARCIKKFETALAAGRLKADATDMTTFINGTQLPSAIIAEDGKTLSELLGLPVSVSSLLDFFQETVKAAEVESPVAVQWLQAMPVGVDLQALPLGLALHLLTDPEQGIAGTLAEGSAEKDIFTTLIGLHQRETAQSQTVAPAEWSALRERATALACEADKPTRVLLNDASGLMRPYQAFNATAFSELIAAIALSNVLAIHNTWWSIEETAAREKMQKSMAAVRADLGERPSEDSAGADFDKKYSDMAEKVRSEMLAAFPLMPERERLLREATLAASSGGKNVAWTYVLHRFLESKALVL